VSHNEVANVALPLASLSANICAELAAGLSDPEGIKKRYELSDEEWNKLRKSPVFRSMLKEAMQRLHGDMNAGKRITIKSEIALEDSIPLLDQFAHDPEVAMPNRLDAIKQLTVLAGRTARQDAQGGASGSGFNVNIVIKGHEANEVIDITSNPPLEAVASEVEG
jgi:hypothetical protein